MDCSNSNDQQSEEANESTPIKPSIPRSDRPSPDKGLHCPSLSNYGAVSAGEKKKKKSLLNGAINSEFDDDSDGGRVVGINNNDESEEEEEEEEEEEKDEENACSCLPASVASKFSGLSCLSLTNLVLLCIVLVGYGMCYSLFSPFFPNEAARKGVGATTVGWIFGIYELVMFIGSAISGKLASHLGLRYMIGSGSLLASGSIMLFGLVDRSPNGVVYVVLCFAIRVVEAIGGSLYTTAAYCVAANLFPGNIAFVYSLMETATGVGFMLGPSIGGVLFTVGGFYLPFVAVGGILLVLGFLSTIFLPKNIESGEEFVTEKQNVDVVDLENGDKDRKKKKKRRRRRRRMTNENEAALPWSRLFRHSVEAWVILFSEAICAVLNNYPEPTASLYFESIGLESPAVIGVVFLVASVVYTVFCVVAGRLADKHPTQVYWFMASGALLATLGFFFVGPSPIVASVVPTSVYLTSGALVVIYIGIALILVPIPRALLNAAQDVGFSEGLETSAMVAGLYNSMWFLGGFGGLPLAGFLAETIGFPWGATIMAGLSLFLLFLLAAGATFRRIPACRKVRQFEHAVLDNDDDDDDDDSSSSSEDEEISNDENSNSNRNSSLSSSSSSPSSSSSSSSSSFCNNPITV